MSGRPAAAPQPVLSWRPPRVAHLPALLTCPASCRLPACSKKVDWDRFAKELQQEEKEEKLEGDAVRCAGQPVPRPASLAPRSLLLGARCMFACAPHVTWPSRPAALPCRR